VKRFIITDVGEFLRRGDYTTWHEEWQRKNASQMNYTQWLEAVLISEWERLEAFGYEDGTIYGREGGYNVDLDYRNFDNFEDIVDWDCIQVVEE